MQWNWVWVKPFVRLATEKFAFEEQAKGRSLCSDFDDPKQSRSPYSLFATKSWLETLLTWNHTTVTDISDICVKVNHIFHHVFSFKTVSMIPVISTSSCSAVLGKPHHIPVECHSLYSHCIYPWGPTQTWFAEALINPLAWQYRLQREFVCGGL